MNQSIKSFVRARSRLSKFNKHLVNNSPTTSFCKVEHFESFDCNQSNEKRILEIGFGDGENLISNALDNLYFSFYGIEVYEMGVANILKTIEKKGINNLKIILGDAIEVLEKNSTEDYFDEILIFFPDPWPKRKHNKRRLISENFLYDIKKVLKNDGVLIIKTDWKDYAEEIEQNVEKTFGRYKKFLDKKSNLTTKYEKIALKENRQITYFETY